MDIKSLKITHLFAAACAVLLLGACEAGTDVDEAELDTGTDMTIAETDPAYDTGADTAMAGDSAFAQARIEDLDTDQDGQVSREEFDTWFETNVWSDLETDDDQQVAHRDVSETFWSWWNTDGNDAIDEAEYRQARENFAFEDVQYGDFAQVAGDDQRLTQDEFHTWFDENVWASWTSGTEDADSIDREHLSNHLWQVWDENGDDRLDAQEVTRFGDTDTATAERTDEPLTDLGAS